MKEELAKKLYADFPRLYRKSKSSLVSQWGLQCGDGWFDLIYRLSGDIEALAREAGLDPKAWRGLRQWPMAIQVKEKFGALRVYVRVPDEIAEKVYVLLGEAERESEKICESCGAPGKMSTELCMYVTCKACEKKRKAMLKLR